MAIFINTQEAADQLNVGIKTVLGLCQRRKAIGFPAVQMERKYLINEELLADWAKLVVREGRDIT